MQYIRIKATANLGAEIPTGYLGKCLFRSFHSGVRNCITESFCVAKVKQFLYSRKNESWFQTNGTLLTIHSKEIFLIVKEHSTMDEDRDRTIVGGFQSYKAMVEFYDTWDEEEIITNSVVSVDILRKKQQETSKAARALSNAVELVQQTISTELTSVFHLLKQNRVMTIIEQDITNNVERVLSNPITLHSQLIVSSDMIYQSPIPIHSTADVHQACPTLFGLLNKLNTSQNKQNDNSKDNLERIWNNSDTVSSVLINARFQGQVQTPSLQQQTLMLTSLSDRQQSLLSQGRWSLSNPKCNQIVDACVASMEMCSTIAFKLAMEKGYKRSFHCDNYNRKGFQSGLRTDGAFTQQYVTQTCIGAIFPPSRTITFNHISPNFEMNREFLPVITWRMLKTNLQAIVTSSGLDEYLGRLKSQFDYPKCVRTHPNPRMHHFIPLGALEGSSASFKTFCDVTLPKAVEGCNDWVFTMFDTEYIQHCAKIRASLSVYPNNEAYKKTNENLNKCVVVPPVFHMTYHAREIIISRRVNFNLVIGPLIQYVFPTYKKNAIDSIHSAAESSRKKPRRDQDNDIDIDPPEVDAVKTNLKRKTRKSVMEDTMIDDDNCKFAMSFQRAFLLLEILLDEYHQIKDNVQFTGTNSKFYQQFFNYELPMAVLGLSDFREGDASTFFCTLPLLLRYFTLTKHPNLVYCCLFLLNNVEHWKINNPGIIKQICENCDMFSDEHIELVHGGVASVGHLNRKDPKDALLDASRLFAINCEQRIASSSSPKDGEVLKRSKMKLCDRFKETRAKVREFITQIAEHKLNVPTVEEKPILECLESTKDILKSYIVDYTYHYTNSQFKKENKDSYNEDIYKASKKNLFYKPVFREAMRGQFPDEAGLTSAIGASCLTENDSDLKEYQDNLIPASLHCPKTTLEEKGTMCHILITVDFFFCLSSISYSGRNKAAKGTRKKRKSSAQGRKRNEESDSDEEGESESGEENDVSEFELEDAFNRSTEVYSLRRVRRFVPVKKTK